MTSRGKSKAAKAKDEEFGDYLKLKARTEKVNYPPISCFNLKTQY